MHLHAPACSCFRGLQNYTTLKRVNGCIHAKICFRGLQNYTTLKRQFVGFAK